MDIIVDSLNKSFGEQEVLKNFSYQFREGKTTCIMGESGCGKTTLIRILLGLETKDSGTVSGVSYGKISAVFQEYRLCENLSAAANIRFVCRRRLADSEINEAFLRVHLDDANQKPVRFLSGGMKQRVAIVRALLADSECIFMDEPLKGLDEDTKRMTADYICEKAAGKTLIVVTHDVKDIELLKADFVLEMDI